MQQELSVCVFRLGDEDYCVELGKVTAVTRNIRIEGAEPLNSGTLIGMTRLRWETMAVVDLNKVLGMKPTDIRENTLFMIVEKESGHVCFPVSDVVGHYEIERGAGQRHP